MLPTLGIKACNSCFGRSNRISTKGYTAILSDICIIADHDSIFDIFGIRL